MGDPKVKTREGRSSRNVVAWRLGDTLNNWSLILSQTTLGLWRHGLSSESWVLYQWELNAILNPHRGAFHGMCYGQVYWPLWRWVAVYNQLADMPVLGIIGSHGMILWSAHWHGHRIRKNTWIAHNRRFKAVVHEVHLHCTTENNIRFLYSVHAVIFFHVRVPKFSPPCQRKLSLICTWIHSLLEGTCHVRVLKVSACYLKACQVRVLKPSLRC